MKRSHQIDGLPSDYFLVLSPLPPILIRPARQSNRTLDHLLPFLNHGIKKQLINQCSDNLSGIIILDTSNKNIIMMSEMELQSRPEIEKYATKC